MEPFLFVYEMSKCVTYHFMAWSSTLESKLKSLFFYENYNMASIREEDLMMEGR